MRLCWAEPDGYVKDWNINGENVTMGVENVSNLGISTLRYGGEECSGRQEEEMEKFDKKAFIAEVKENVKSLYRKNLDEATQAADFPGSVLCCKG